MPKKNKTKTVVINAKVKDGRPVHAFAADIRGKRDEAGKLVAPNGIRWNV